MPNEDMPERKKPTVRKSTVIKDSSAPSARRSAAVKTPSKVEEIKKGVSAGLSSSLGKMNSTTKTALLMALSAILSAVITYTFITPSSVASQNSGTFSEVIAGKVALTEQELIDAVKKAGVDVYWAGPVQGALYTLAVPADGQAYVRYLPKGQGIEDTKPNYVVIATYTTTDAFTSTQAAGNTTNGVSFINADGAAVYYSKDIPTNVYVAYPDKNYQVEIFDPIATTALDIASKSGALRLVK